MLGLRGRWRRPLGPTGVRVNAVCPGYIETPMTMDGLSVPEIRQRWEAKTALRRIGQPRHAAHVVRFLLSEEYAFVTGQAVTVDGGVRVVDGDGSGLVGTRRLL